MGAKVLGRGRASLHLPPPIRRNRKVGPAEMQAQEIVNWIAAIQHTVKRVIRDPAHWTKVPCPCNLMLAGNP